MDTGRCKDTLRIRKPFSFPSFQGRLPALLGLGLKKIPRHGDGQGREGGDDDGIVGPRV